ncbi:MAG: sigma 54-interacting transcriptional regulator [Melioribacteraceae bacterium]|nr:sigma 54-interacting transcriptional regulator [Melioribacteraceae bacterium]
MIKNFEKIETLGQLKEAGYKPLSVKDEMRKNLIELLSRKTDSFSTIIGYSETVIPDIQTAILSRHNIILLGLRGQAKTKIARLMINMLDEYIPVIKDSEINDDPFHPISRYGKDTVEKSGDDTPVEWLDRESRYTEKLATPDVTIADLIGDVDPIKAASLKLHYSDERVIHFGLIPRSHRGIFVINELPDLQARIQVALFNILQEKDIQIRGFKIRLPLDVQFVFTANPEDYTNRGSIVTPLKDRIDSQILTHYPKTIEDSKSITRQEAKLTNDQQSKIVIPELVKDIVEQIAFEARQSEYVDHKSGVSARLTISAFENLVSTAERRMLINNEEKAYIRISDFTGVIQSITGKIELVYEGELEGPAKVAQILISKAVRNLFSQLFPSPEKIKKKHLGNPYQEITSWFSKGNYIDLLGEYPNHKYIETLKTVPSLENLIIKNHPSLMNGEKYLYMEFLLHGLAEYSLLSKHHIEHGTQFKDMLSGMFTVQDEDEYNDEESFT